MSTAQIVVQQLSKTYRVPEREAGLAASFKNLLRRNTCDAEAVREISFALEAGDTWSVGAAPTVPPEDPQPMPADFALPPP